MNHKQSSAIEGCQSQNLETKLLFLSPLLISFFSLAFIFYLWLPRKTPSVELVASRLEESQPVLGEESSISWCVKDGSSAALSLDDAVRLGEVGVCGKTGALVKQSSACNGYTGAWWIDLRPFEPVSDCNPACVVSLETRDSEVNWRCTGLIE